ncbi:MAG: hypothetical protein AAF485_13515 [Chloroflexota bacterium]
MQRKNQQVRNGVGLVTLLYTGLTILMTWPVTLHLFDGVAGFDGRDSLQWVWFNWWGVKSILALQSNPGHVDWLYYPVGAEHSILPATLFVPLFATPFTLLGGSKFAYNIIFLTSYIFGGTFTYLFLRVLVRNKWAAFVGGAIFIFAPHRVGHAMGGHLLLIVTWSFPLYALAITYLIRRPSWRWALVGGISLVILTLTQPIHTAYFALPLSVIYGGGLLWLTENRVERLKVVTPYLGGMAVFAAILLLPFFMPLLRSTIQGEQHFFTNTGLEEHSTDLLAFILPSPYHPFLQIDDDSDTLLTTIISSPRHLEERMAYLGLIPILLTIWALIHRRKTTYLWLILGLFSAILAMGPTLQILQQNTGVTLPYAWLMDLPFLRWSRTPGRLNETTVFALATLSALGLADILQRVRANFGSLYLVSGITFFILIDYLIFFPFPVGGQIVPNFYTGLAQEAPAQTLIDMPVSGSRRASNYSLLYQTMHDRPIAGGYIERDPPDTVEFAQFFDRLLSPALAEAVIPNSPTIETRQQILQVEGIEQVTARRWLMTDRAATATLDFIPQILGPAYYDAEDILAWQTPSVANDLPDYTLLLSEKGWEMVDGGLHLKERGYLFIYAADTGTATLSWHRFPSPPNQQLQITTLDPLSLSPEGGPQNLELNVEAGFNWFLFEIIDCDDCRIIFSQLTVQ